MEIVIIIFKKNTSIYHLRAKIQNKADGHDFFWSILPKVC